MNDYATRRERPAAELRSTPATPVRLAKSSSNLFRDRPDHPRRSLDVRAFDHVLGVDAAAGRIEAEGTVPYDVLAAAALKKGCMPMVVPQLKSITLGGATAGVGIEASSFRHGLVHETILDMDVLTGDGRIVLCTPDNEHADLFYGFPNSYGTLGYALRLRARTMPVKRFVKIERARHHDPATYFRDLDAACRSDADFVDGVVFARDEMFINTGHFVESAPTPTTTPARPSTTARYVPIRWTTSRPRRFSGGGTPTGSGVQRISARSIRWCARCSGART